MVFDFCFGAYKCYFQYRPKITKSIHNLKMMMITDHRSGQEEAREQLLRLWRAVEQLIKEGKVIVTIVIVTTAVDIMASQQIRIYNF